MDLDYETLKARHRELRDGFEQSLSLRVHRALSWLQRAEKETADPDAQFIFLWIAFNAAYANEIPADLAVAPEQSRFQQFLRRLVEVDREKLLYKLIWEQFPGPIRVLIDNPYVFKPFWRFQNAEISQAEWESAFGRAHSAALRALSNGDSYTVLSIVFQRLYVLRNQIMHGGSTWNSSVNRAQVTDGANIMGHLVPMIILLLMQHPEEEWGTPAYPVVEDPARRQGRGGEASA